MSHWFQFPLSPMVRIMAFPRNIVITTTTTSLLVWSYYSTATFPSFFRDFLTPYILYKFSIRLPSFPLVLLPVFLFFCQAMALRCSCRHLLELLLKPSRARFTSTTKLKLIDGYVILGFHQNVSTPLKARAVALHCHSISYPVA